MTQETPEVEELEKKVQKKIDALGDDYYAEINKQRQNIPILVVAGFFTGLLTQWVVNRLFGDDLGWSNLFAASFFAILAGVEGYNGPQRKLNKRLRDEVTNENPDIKKALAEGITPQKGPAAHMSDKTFKTIVITFLVIFGGMYALAYIYTLLSGK